MGKRSRKQFGAFSLIELFIVVAIIAVLLFILLPQLARSKARSSRINCTSQMKQIGLSFKTFAIDNEDKLPFEVSQVNGGTMELISRGNVWPHFSVMSNELSTAKILVCPNDTERMAVMATNSYTNGGFPLRSDLQVSYFLVVDSTNQTSQAVLAGDRCIGLGRNRLRPGLNVLETNSNFAWVRSWHKDGVNEGGNVLLADGSVSQVQSKRLPELFASELSATNRIIVP